MEPPRKDADAGTDSEELRVSGSDALQPSASEIVGAEQAEFDANVSAGGRASSSNADASSQDRDGAGRQARREPLGGTGTHHRATYSDPLPAVGMKRAAGDSTDDATGHRTPGPGSPEWMRGRLPASGAESGARDPDARS